MVWIVLVLVLAAVVAVSVALVIRYNQLSLNRSLTVEARRQFDVARSTRHGIIPVFVAEARSALGDRDPRIADLETAVVTAQTVRTRSDAGVAEHVVTDAARTVAAGLREKATAAEAEVGFAGDLFSQLDEHETHIGAAVRHHNASVRAYMRRRAQVLSAPLRGAYAPITEIDYTPSEGDAHALERSPSPGAEDYRPGRVAEGL